MLSLINNHKQGLIMTIENKLIVALINDQAKAPTREPESVGYDVYAYGQHAISPDETKIIPLGINIALPPGYGAFIWDRSSFGAKGIHIFRELISTEAFSQDTFNLVSFGGVIDWSYRGQMGVILHSFLKEIYVIKHGDRLAQFIIQKCEEFPIEIITMEDYLELPPTDRNISGFGSSDGQTTPEEAQAAITKAKTSEEMWKKPV